MTSAPLTLWFTGLPASGKSTLANLSVQELKQGEKQVQVLDSDNLRAVLTPEPTYTPEERDWFYEVLAYIGGLLAQNNVITLIAATAHRRDYRLQARDYMPNLLEVYVKCPLETCMTRDQKGIYQRAMAGEADHVPGVHELYEAPETPAIVVDTEENSPQKCLDEILARLAEFGYST